MEPSLTDVMDELKKLRLDVEIIKNSVESDDELTEEDHRTIKIALKEYDRGEFDTLEEIEEARKNTDLKKINP